MLDRPERHPKLMPMPYDPATLRFYSDEAPVYTASAKGSISRHLDGFLDLLRPGARILELGCGGGLDAEFMAKRGFNVHPTDGTPKIAAKAQERLHISVRIMRFDEIEERDTYDAVHASASLLHVPIDDLTTERRLLLKAVIRRPRRKWLKRPRACRSPRSRPLPPQTRSFVFALGDDGLWWIPHRRLFGQGLRKLPHASWLGMFLKTDEQQSLSLRSG